MSTRFTLASNGCNRETGRGQQHVESKALRDRNRCRSAKGQDKTCMAKAKLHESQIRYLSQVVTHQRLKRHRRVEHGNPINPCSNGTSPSVNGMFTPAARTTLHRKAKDRTGRLTTSHLNIGVNAGSPKRVGFTNSARRRSRHISQTPGVTSGTAALGRMVKNETESATARRISSDRVKGGALVGTSKFMTTRGFAPRRR